jgi:hypothetical protein
MPLDTIIATCCRIFYPFKAILAIVDCQSAERGSRMSTRDKVLRASVVKRRYRNEAVHSDKGDVCRVQIMTSLLVLTLPD